MAYTKLVASINLPILGEASTQDKDEARNIRTALGSLIFCLTLFISDLVVVVNDLIEGRIAILKLQKQRAAPAAIEDGMTVYADGTDWDPGSGEGVYTYYGGVWNKL